ncbi:MAG TPA: helix-turn-helix transcriptional regulator [Thermoanaerobaculia bacterium]|jgi:DNA-binding transcriptional ArsR family regulator|nr:helix-turn-helix transcriptional regulator [Thermoanaerobaculia bacterium]
MDVDAGAARIAAAIGEPGRARMLYCLLDGHARTSTELAIVAGVSPSTASVHLKRLEREGLIRSAAQGRHRYYTLEGRDVARLLERLSVLAGGVTRPFVPATPSGLRAARTCYDHIAGALGVALHDRIVALRWLTPHRPDGEAAYAVTPAGNRAFAALDIDLAALRAQRRRFAYACLDWSERRPHVGGALGAAILHLAIRRKWVVRELDSRALRLTGAGQREMALRFGLSA